MPYIYMFGRLNEYSLCRLYIKVIYEKSRENSVQFINSRLKSTQKMRFKNEVHWL